MRAIQKYDFCLPLWNASSHDEDRRKSESFAVTQHLQLSQAEKFLPPPKRFPSIRPWKKSP